MTEAAAHAAREALRKLEGVRVHRRAVEGAEARARLAARVVARVDPASHRRILVVDNQTAPLKFSDTLSLPSNPGDACHGGGGMRVDVTVEDISAQWPFAVTAVPQVSELLLARLSVGKQLWLPASRPRWAH